MGTNLQKNLPVEAAQTCLPGLDNCCLFQSVGISDFPRHIFKYLMSLDSRGMKLRKFLKRRKLNLVDSDRAESIRERKMVADLTVKESLHNPKMLLALGSPSDFIFRTSRIFLVHHLDSKIELFSDRGDAD